MFDSIFVASDIIKYRVGRQSVISNRGSILSAVEVLHPIAEAFCRPREYFIRLRKHSAGRESTPSDCGSILPAVRVLHPIEACIVSAV